MAQKINYSKTTRYNIIDSEKAGNYKQYRALRNAPTAEQRKYFDYLFKLCEENNISASPSIDKQASREDVSNAINYMLRALSNVGIRASDTWKDKKRFRFDKDGNVVDATTGKIHKRRS